MQKDLFKRIIADSQDKNLAGVIDRNLEIPLDTGKIICLIGVRRSGKTHVLYSIISKLRKTVDPSNIVYINFEDDRLFPLELKDLTLCWMPIMSYTPTRRMKKFISFLTKYKMFRTGRSLSGDSMTPKTAPFF